MSIRYPVAGVVVAAVVVAGPLGLTLRGRTSPLAWTHRLRRLAAAWALLEVALVVVGVVSGLASPLAVVAALAVPLGVDLACRAMSPVEVRLSAHFVDEAAARLQRVAPIVVAITGSYGKTSTKGHIACLVGTARTVVATPASFNNRAGLARAVNEHLAEGTEVFVAEMGTYGPGEIADLCRWCPPDIAVITAIGPVHLERFGSEDRVLEAKSEIIESAARRRAPGGRPEAVGAGRPGRVSGEAGAQVLGSGSFGRCRCGAHRGREPDVGLRARVGPGRGDRDPGRGAARQSGHRHRRRPRAEGRSRRSLAARLLELPPVDHRLQAVRSASGATILDDTYNSNPAGASAALRALASAGPDVASAGPDDLRRAVVVTPGMVELGPRQFEENREFGAAVASTATDLLIVGRTNRRALLAGASSVDGSKVQATMVPNRQQAVDWVRRHLAGGDVVLYENDLPDHYP